MRKIFVLAMLLIVSETSFSQQTNPSPTLSKQDYLKKSKKQKTAAWILLGGGGALVTTGMAIGINGTAEEIVGAFTGEKSNKFEIGAGLFFTGLASMLGSIPFFIASSKNMNKGISLSLKNEKVPLLPKRSFVYHSVPSLSIKISL